jgi:hypothetical protein
VIRIERTPWDFRAISSVGVLIKTFGTPEQAAAWVETEAPNFPGCVVQRVRTTTTTETVFEQPMTQERAA